MKKITLLIIIFAWQNSFAQNVFPDTGNVGIGTLAPTVKLHINNGDNSYGAILANASESSFSLYTKTLNSNQATPEVFRLGLKYNSTENNGFISFYRGLSSFGGYLGFSTNGVEQLRIATNGNIGIGTDTPVSKVSVAGSITLDSGLNSTSSRPSISSGTLANGEIRAYSKTGNAYDDGFLRLSAGGGTNTSTKSYIDLSGYSGVPDMARNIVLGTYGVERMRIDMTGKVGIGTSVPDEVLTVKGKIHTQEVRVDMSGPLVPDYVFAEDYKLKSLQEVENYIKENKHLPEIPSAQEIEKNGLMLAEMNMNLLKKIEEMTLYMIEQSKEIKALKKENESFKTLSERFSKIENQLKNKN